MRKWGIVITVSYALIVLGLLVPGAALLAEDRVAGWPAFYKTLLGVYAEWIFWVPVAAVLAGQALLLFLSVDTSRQRLKPRAHILVSGSVAAMLFALLTIGAVSSLGVGIYGDHFGENFINTRAQILGAWGVIWLLWGIVFYLYFRNSTAVVKRIISWLLKGSVLELLVAIPCHVIVRRRQDCCAPMVTSFGIATGLAIMLLSFGPSVLLLYKKRLDAYSTRRSATE